MVLNVVRAQARSHQMNGISSQGCNMGSPMPMTARILPVAQHADPAAAWKHGIHLVDQLHGPREPSNTELLEPSAKRVCHGLASTGIQLETTVSPDKPAGRKRTHAQAAAMAQAEE